MKTNDMPRKRFSTFALVASLFMMIALFSYGETMLVDTDSLVLEQPIEAVLPPGAIREKDYAKGSVTVNILVNAAWTVNGVNENAIRLKSNSGEYLTTTLPKWNDYGCLVGNSVFKLEFPLPPKVSPEETFTLLIPSGIRRWTAIPPTSLKIWIGPRLEGHVFVDKMNRNCIAILEDLGDEATEYEFEFPGRTVVTKSPTARHRINGNRNTFYVTCRAKLADGGMLESKMKVVPNKVTTPPPLADGEILVGLCVYPTTSEEKRQAFNPAGWTRYKCTKEEELNKLIDEECVNLIVPWFNPPVESVAAAAEKDIYTMTIYQYCDAQKSQEYAKAGKNRFWLNNNIGEYASYLYQDLNCRPQVVNNTGDLDYCRDFFVNNYIRRGVENNHLGYPYIFSTSGSTVSNYEMAGGVEFMLCELYALGAMNLGWASAEMRGAARKWLPEFWGGWLATEWQSTGVPYLVPQKYGMLRVGLYQQYLMGSSIIILESGSQSTQAGEYTVDLEENPEFPRRDYNCDEEPVKNYKKEMTDFYQFVKNNPRSSGTPETVMASVLGNCGSYVGLYIDWFAAFSQHEHAQKDPNWLYGDPERTDVAVQQTIFPVPADCTGKYTNNWLGGSPYGQCDIVNVDDETTLDDLERYGFLFYGGWNTMTPIIMNTLRQYVENGGNLFISLPHFSTRTDREYRNFTVEDLVNGGNLDTLCSINVTQRDLVSGPVSSQDIAGLNATLDEEPIAIAEFGENVEVLATAGDKPLFVKEKIGKGSVYVMLSWEYPGKGTLAPVYSNVLKHLADAFAAPTRIRNVDGSGDDAIQYIAYAVWPQATYLLNTDCLNSHTFEFTAANGETQVMTLEPMEFKTLK